MKNLENRNLSAEFEVRQEEDKPTVIEGYAARFDEETVIGGAFVEKVARNAFDDSDMSNTVALFNHDMNMPLARAGQGLELTVDENGLKYRFELGNQSYAKDLAENIRMGNVSTSSFGFTVTEDTWEKRGADNVRTIEKVGILFDVSPTTQGAYPTTEVGLRSMELAFGDTSEVEPVAEEVTEDTEVREADAPEAVETTVEEVTEEVAEDATEETPAEETEETEERDAEPTEDTNEETPASEEEVESDDETAEEEEADVEAEIETESEAGPAEEEDNTVRASEISSIMENNKNAAPAVVQNVGDFRNADKFDISKAIREAATTGLTGVELQAYEAAQEEARSQNMVLAGNVALPSEWRADAASMTVGAGGTQTNEGIFDAGQDFISNFRPTTVAEKLGATMFRNSVGNVVIPVQNDNIDAAELNELADLDLTNVGFEQVSIAPQRIGAGTSFSKQLLAQTSADLGSFIMGDLKRTMDLKADKYVIDTLEAGLTYVDDTAGAYSGTSAPDFAELAGLMEMDLRIANVDLGNAKFMLDPAALRNFKRAALDAGSGMFAGEGANIYGYGYETTNQTTAGKIVLGDFRDLVICEWGGLDLIVDPYTQAQKHAVVITANMHIGAAVRRAAAFKAVQVA